MFFLLSLLFSPLPSSFSGKRLRLRNDDDGYDVHIVSDRLDEVSPPVTLVFFVLTVADFNKVNRSSTHHRPISLPSIHDLAVY